LADRQESDIAGLRRWAQAWSDEINRRIYRETSADDELA
jgi:hypothetical protein